MSAHDAPMPPRLSDLTADLRDRFLVADAVRFLSCASFEHTTTAAAARAFVERYPYALSTPELRKALDDGSLVTKAAPRHTPSPSAVIPPGMTGDPNYGGLLPRALLEPLIQAMQRETVLARIPGLIRAPMYVPLPVLSVRPLVKWVGQTSPKPASKFQTTSTPMTPTKCASILVFSEELMRVTGANAETLLSVLLVDASVTFVDSEFCSAHPGVVDVSPRGMLNGVVATPTAATTAGTVSDVLTALFTQRPHTRTPVLLVSPATAGALAASSTLLPQLTSAGTALVTTIGAGPNIIAIDSSAIYYSDTGGEVDISREAALQMNDTPDDPATASTIFTSLWDMNLVGVRLDRFVTWSVSETNAIAWAVAP
jgi:hypothetical protein